MLILLLRRNCLLTVIYPWGGRKADFLELEVAGEKEVDAAVASARAAFNGPWSELTVVCPSKHPPPRPHPSSMIVFLVIGLLSFAQKGFAFAD